MTDTTNLHDDLRFVRQAVERRRREPAPGAIRWVWAIYVLVGYTLLDIDHRWGGIFLGVAGAVCGVLSWFIGAVAARRAGEADAVEGRIEALHWIGAGLGVISIVALAAIYPALRSNLGGQLIVVTIALVYWAYGVHRDRHFLWLAVLMLVGAVTISFVPAWPWTCLGVVIAAGLVAPTFFADRTGRSTDTDVRDAPEAS